MIRTNDAVRDMATAGLRYGWSMALVMTVNQYGQLGDADDWTCLFLTERSFF